MSRVLQAICKVPWAITEDSLRQILAIAARENEITPEALAALAAKQYEDAEYLSVRDGVGILTISGPIFRYANLLTAISGATSLDILARDLGTALKSDDIHSILLSIDSPGGEVSGTSEFADMIFAARTIKPVYAYISDEGASAAYWIASSAEKVVTANTAKLGSIGVVATLSKPDPKNSSEIEFVSSQSPNKRPKINTEEGRAQVQAIIDAIAEVFVEAVARNRGVTADTVLNDFGKGGLLVGKAAVDAGLADSVGSFEGTLAALIARSEGSAPRGSQNKRSSHMGFKDKWEQFLAAMDGEGDPETKPESKPEAINTTPASIKPDDRIVALEAENRRLRAERYQAEATAFAEKYITSMQAFPVERESIIAAVVQAASDDATLGVAEGATSRVAMLAAIYDKRPKHQLTAESLTPTLVKLLSDATAQPAGTSAKEPTDDEVKQLLSQTPLGASVLRHMEATNGAAK